MKRSIFFVIMCAYSMPNLYSEDVAAKLPTKKIVIIGAGLAGLTTAYRLYKKGFDVHVYEARNRVGGRILSAIVNGNVAEFGGENIADGGDADNIRQLVQELGLKLFHSASSFNHVFHDNNILLSVEELIRKQNFNVETLKDQLYAIAKTSASLQDVLDRLFESDEPLKRCLSTRIAGYEGASADQLSSLYVSTLYHMLRGGICTAHQTNETLFARISEGNSKLPEALAEKLGNRVHLKMPLVSIAKNEQDKYILTFENGSTTTTDILVLAMPCPVYNDIAFTQNVIPADRLAAIRSICNGKNAKIIVPLGGSFPRSTIFVNDYLGIFTYVDAMITLYFRGQWSRFETGTIGQVYAKAKPLLDSGFEQSSLPEQEPVMARDELFGNYFGPVGYSWPNDRFAKGSYSYIAPGQEELFTTFQEHEGLKVKTFFAPIDQLYFAGEHASTLSDVPGTMEAACQSGNLVADMIEKTLLKIA